MKKPFLEAGEFVTTHGITGELRLHPWADDNGFLTRFGTLYLDDRGARALKVEGTRPHKNICLVKLEGVNSIEAARPYIGRTVYISRAEANLPEGAYFIQDLLGARVVDKATGEEYGHIRTITHPGRHDVYEIERADASTTLFPAAPPFVHSIDTEAGVVTVTPIPGMFDASSAT